MLEFFKDIVNLFKGKQLNAETIEGSFVELVRNGKVDTAI